MKPLSRRGEWRSCGSKRLGGTRSGSNLAALGTYCGLRLTGRRLQGILRGTARLQARHAPYFCSVPHTFTHLTGFLMKDKDQPLGSNPLGIQNGRNISFISVG